CSSDLLFGDAGGHALLRRQTGHQTDQESRSAARRRAISLISMDITISASFLPHTDHEASIAFYRDILGFEVRNDVGYNGLHWITVGPPDQNDTAIVLYPPEASPGLTD